MNTIAQFRILFLATLLFCVSTATAFAQDDDAIEAGLAKANEKFKSILEEVDGLFFKQAKTDSGLVYFVLMWEGEGETSKIQIELRHLGQYNGELIFGVLAYTLVAQSEGSMPPAVIKAVATMNETTGIGSVSMSEAFDTVYVNFSAPSDTMTPGQLWITCAVMHKNRIRMKNLIQEVAAASR